MARRAAAPGGSRLAVRVQPNARADALVGWMADGALKLKVAAPAVEGRANGAVVALVAAVLGCRVAQVTVVRGASSRAKVVEIAGLDGATVRRRLEAALAAGAGHGG